MITPAGKSLRHNIDPAAPDGRLLGRTILRGDATPLTELQDTVATIPRHVGAVPSKPDLPNAG